MRTARRPPLATDFGAQRRQRLKDRETGADCAFGVLLQCVRIAKIDQYTVAHELCDEAIEAPSGIAHNFLIGTDHIAHILGIELR